MGTEITLHEMVLCARRELAFRRRVYPRLVGNGKMSPEDAEHQIALMSAILDNLQKQYQPDLF